MINYYDKMKNVCGEVEILREDVKIFRQEPSKKKREDIFEDINAIRLALSELKTSLNNLYFNGD